MASRTRGQGRDVGGVEGQAAVRRAEARARGLVPTPASEGRSRNQQAIKRADTKPEIQLRSMLHSRGLRFRKDYRLTFPDGRTARPDVVFTRLRVAVFYDSCFWHSCPEHGRLPAVNHWYWAPKLARTVERDTATTAALRAHGWLVIRIWEHEDLASSVDRVNEAVSARRSA